MLACLLLPLLAAPLAMAQDNNGAQGAQAFEFSGGALGEALFAVTTAYDVNIIADEALIQEKTAPSVSGALTPEEALDRLLADTNLALRNAANGAFVVFEPAADGQEDTGPAPADDETTSVLPDDGAVEEVIVTANRVPTPINQVARTVSVIYEEQLNTQLARTSNVGDLLAALVPGFGAPNQTDLLRGFTLRGRDPQYLIDGVPLEFNGGAAVNESPLTKFDPQSLGRIEVLYGPTALYGEGAPGGVIQFFTRDPSAKPYEVELRQQFSLYPHADEPFGSESLSWKTTASVSGTLERFDYFTMLSYDSQNAVMDDDGDIVQTFSFQDELTFFAKLGYNFDGNQRLQFTYNRIETEEDGRIYDYQFGDDGFIFGTLSENQTPFQWSA
ncbi:MAG: TonB-dependent receptor, partial [Pseudomonadota bacterium]